MADNAEQPKLVPVGEGFTVRQAVDNMAWIDLGEYAVVVDALEEASAAEEVFAAISETLGEKPIRALLNTHTHYDHTALNETFQKRFGTEIVNQRTTRLPPEGRWFTGSLRRAQMLPMGGCHTDEDCIVWVPEDKALFVGDIFGWGLIPSGGLSDKQAQRLRETYQRLIDFEAETVIPGHGPLCSTNELKRWVEYFDGLQQQIAAAVGTGQSDAEITRQVSPPEDMVSWWRFLDWKHSDSVSKVLSAFRARRLHAK